MGADALCPLILFGACAMGISGLSMLFKRGAPGAADPRCPRCDYSMVGISADARCPECGLTGWERRRLGTVILGRSMRARIGPASALAGFLVCSVLVLLVVGKGAWELRAIALLGLAFAALGFMLRRIGVRMTPRSAVCITVLTTGAATAITGWAILDAFVFHPDAMAGLVLMMLPLVVVLGASIGVFASALVTLHHWFQR